MKLLARFFLATFVAALMLGAMPARAQVTWDADGVTTGPQDGAGTWDTVGTNWWDGSTNVAWPNLTTSSAIFGAGSGAAGTVTVSGSVITNAMTFNAPGSGTYTLSGGTISLQGTTPTITANVNASIGSLLAGSAGLVKAGNGTLTLSSSNSYTGGTQIDAGVLVGSNRSSFGTSTIAIGASGTAQLTAVATGFYTNGYMNAVTGSGVLRVVGATGTSVNYSGDLSGFTGTVQMEATSANPWVGYGNRSGPSANLTGSNAKFVVSGGVAAQFRGLLTLLPSSVSGTVAMGELSGDGAIHAPQNSAAQVVTYEIGALSTSSTFSGAFMDNSTGAKIMLRKVGSGTLTLSGTNNTRPYSGGTQLNGGVLALGSANALSSSGAISFGGGTLRFSSANTTDYSSRFSTAAGQAYSLDTNGQNITVGTALSSSGGTLTKLGSGTLTLTAANTFTGNTTIAAGTLKLGSGGSFANSPLIVVGDAGSNGAVFDLTEKSTFAIGAGQTLKGKGTVLLGENTTVTINGLLSPGNSPGLLTWSGSGSVALSGTTLMEVWGTSRGANPGYDAIDLINGTDLTFGGILQLDFNQLFADGTSFNLFTPDGTSTLADTFSSITMVGSSYTDLTFTNNAGFWTTNTGAANQSMSFNSATGTLSIIVVPEPGTLALAGLGLAAAALASRRRREARKQGHSSRG